MTACNTSKHSGVTGCGRNWEGVRQAHCVARGAWSTHVDGRCHTQSPALILVGIRERAPLVNVARGDESTERPLLIHNWKLLDSVLPENPLGVLERGANRGGDQL